MTQAKPTTAPPIVSTGPVRIVPGDRRTPLVVVPVIVGPVTIDIGVSGLKSGPALRIPMAADGGDAISATPAVLAAMVEAIHAAVAADPNVAQHLARK